MIKMSRLEKIIGSFDFSIKLLLLVLLSSLSLPKCPICLIGNIFDILNPLQNNDKK